MKKIVFVGVSILLVVGIIFGVVEYQKTKRQYWVTNQFPGYRFSLNEDVFGKSFKESGLNFKAVFEKIEFVIVGKPLETGYIISSAGRQIKGSRYEPDNNSKMFRVYIYYDKELLGEIKEGKYERLDEDVFEFLCNGSTKVVDSNSWLECQKWAGEYVKDKPSFFKLDKGIGLNIVKPVFAGCSGSVGCCENRIGCVCSDAGYTCNSHGANCGSRTWNGSGWSYSGVCSCTGNDYEVGSASCSLKAGVCDPDTCSYPGSFHCDGESCPACNVVCNGAQCGQNNTCGGSCPNTSDVTNPGTCSGCGQQSRTWSNPCDSPSSGTTTAGCGCNECGSSLNCGMNNRDCSADVCVECVTCAVGTRCGQARNCGGLFCGNEDNGNPTTPTIINPDSTNDSYPPGTVNLQWTAVAALSDYYEVEVYNDTTGISAWSNSNVGNVTNVNAGPINSPAVYRWRVRAVNTTCGTDYGTWSAWGYFRINSAPMVVNVTLRNASNVVAPPDGSGRNHICEPVFYDNPVNRRMVNFEATLRDIDGWAQITTANITWNGRNYPLTLAAGAGTDRVGSVTVTHPAGDNGPGTYPLNIAVVDTYGASGSDASRHWKVWDCSVPTTGTIYDGSPIPICVVSPPTYVGFDNPAPPTMNLTALSYTQTDNSQVYNMVVAGPNYSGPALVWGKTYNITFNADLEATGMIYRMGSVECGNTSQFTYGNTNVDPYGVNVNTTIDYSFIRDQEGWYQVAGSGILGGAQVRSAVPVTCSGACTPGLSMSTAGVGVSSDGLVASAAINSSSGCNLGTAPGECYRSYPRDTYVIRNVLSEKYGYQKIYNSYFGKYGLGTTFSGDRNLAQVIAGLPGGQGVALVNGNLSITGNNTVNPGQFLMVVVSGAINIDQAATQVQGVFVADNGISGDGTNGTALAISGVLYSAQNISFTRTFADKTDNNTAPAATVTYRPDLIFNMPPSLVTAISLKY